MHIAAMRNDPDDFALRRQQLGLKICEIWEMHESLIRVYPMTPASQGPLYNVPKPYLLIDLPGAGVKFPGASPTEGLRRVRVSGSDIVYRYMLEASTCAHLSPEQYRQFDRSNPQSLPCLYYILQNVYMTARSMDESSVHYLLEANSVSEQMRSIFIALCVVASVVELVTVTAILRPALTRIYEERTGKVGELNKLDDSKLLGMNRQMNGMHTAHTKVHSADSKPEVTVANATAGTRIQGDSAERDSDDESVQSAMHFGPTDSNVHEGESDEHFAHGSLETKVCFLRTHRAHTPTTQHHPARNHQSITPTYRRSSANKRMRMPCSGFLRPFH